MAQVSFAQLVVFEAGRDATPARVAAVLAVTLLPFSLVGPFAGVLIDRWSRRNVLVNASLVRAVIALGAVTTAFSHSQAAAFAGILLLLATSRFVLAAKGAALPRTVSAERLVAANATSSVAGMVSTFLGAVSGTTFVGGSAALGFALTSLLYLVAAGMFTQLAGVGGGVPESRVARRMVRVLQELRDGLRATRDPAIGFPLAAVWLHRLLLGAGFVLLVLVADSKFHLRVSGYGLALAVTGVAAFAGSLAAPWCARRWPPLRLLPVSFLPPAAAAYVAGTAPNLAVLVASLGVTAFSFQLLKVLVDAVVGGACPDRVRGRVFSVYDVLYNVAFVLAGLLLVPLWQPDEVTRLLWWLAAAFLAGWLLFAWLLGSRRLPAAVSVKHRWWLRLLSFGCGGLTVLAFPSVAWWWFAWVALVPLLLVIRAAPSGREAALRGWYGGAGYLSAAVYWLLPAIGPALPLVCFGLGLLYAPWGWAAWRLLGGAPRTRGLLTATLVLPAMWVAAEAVRSWQSLGGPWVLIGTSQWNQPTLLASAALGGVWLTSFLVVAVNTAVTGAIVVGSGMNVLPGVRRTGGVDRTPTGTVAGTRSSRAREWVLLAVVAVCAVAVGPAWAAARPDEPGGRELRIAVVQPGVMNAPNARLARLERLTEQTAARKPRLVVWGESSVGADLWTAPRLSRRLSALTRRVGADLLVNVDARSPAGQIAKTSVLITRSGPDGRYVKTRLVPFGEYIPLRPLLGWIVHISKAAAQNRARGHGPVVIRGGPVPFGPLVCFESTFPDLGRREVQLGAQLIVYQSATTTFQGTWAQPQHASLAAVRAVETGRPVLHVALTGTTAAFDSTGHQLLWIPAGRAATAVVPIRPTTGRTPFVVAGDWVLACSAVVLAVALAGASLRAPNTPAPDHPGKARLRRSRRFIGTTNRSRRDNQNRL